MIEKEKYIKRLLRYYKKRVPPIPLPEPGVKNYQFIKKELRALLYNDAQNGGELIKLWTACNAGKPSRGGRLRKEPFALYWLFIRFGKEKENAMIGYIRKQFGLPSGRLVWGQKTKRTKALYGFLDRLFEDDRELYGKLFGIVESSDIDIAKILNRYEKRGTLEKSLFNAVLRPDIGQAKEKNDQINFLEKEISQIHNFPFQSIDPMLMELAEMNPKDLASIKRKLKEIKREDKLMGKIFEFLKSQRKPITQRDLQRKVGSKKPFAALCPALELLEFERIIIWNKQEKTIALNSYNPRNPRKFIWLAASSWPRSRFEPYLANGKIYRAKDFREYVVEEWVRTGEAGYI